MEDGIEQMISLLLSMEQQKKEMATFTKREPVKEPMKDSEKNTSTQPIIQ